MKTTDMPYSERVVKMVETCEDALARTFYCIQDPILGYWMSQEPFDERIWTRDVRCRREFPSRLEAEAELERFLEWRLDASITSDREAA